MELDFNGQGKAALYVGKSRTRMSCCLSTGSNSLITLKTNRIWKVCRSCVEQSRHCRELWHCNSWGIPGTNSKNIDQALSKTLPAFHALTGCDTVSQLCGIGKTTACKISNNTTDCWMALDMWLSVMEHWHLPKSSFVGYTHAMKLTRRSTMFGSNSSTKVQKTLRSYVRPSFRCNITSSEHTTSVLSGIHQWLHNQTSPPLLGMASTKILPQDKHYHV